MNGFLWSWYLHKYFCDVVRNKLQRVEFLKTIKSSRKKYFIRTCFKFWPMINIFRKLLFSFMACLQIYRESLSLATFLQGHSSSKEVSYLYWKNRYPNLKTTCHIKLKFFLWIKVLESLLLAKYLISVAATLM